MGFFSFLFDRFRTKPHTKDDFAHTIMDSLRKIGDARTAEYDREMYRLIFLKNGKQDGIINLHNLFIEYNKSNAGEREAWLKRTALGLAKPMDIPEEFEDA